MSRDDGVELVTQSVALVRSAWEQPYDLHEVIAEVIHLGTHEHIHPRDSLGWVDGVQCVNQSLQLTVLASGRAGAHGVSMLNGSVVSKFFHMNNGSRCGLATRLYFLPMAD